MPPVRCMIFNVIVGTEPLSSIGRYQRPVEGTMPGVETPPDTDVVFAGISGDN